MTERARPSWKKLFRHIADLDECFLGILARLKAASHIAQEIDFLRALFQFLHFLRQLQVGFVQLYFRLYALGDVLNAPNQFQGL